MAITLIKLVEVQAGRPFSLTVRHESGEFTVDITDHLNSAAKVFKPLLDAPERFAEAELDEYGACVGWYFDGTGDMEIPADLLWALQTL